MIFRLTIILLCKHLSSKIVSRLLYARKRLCGVISRFLFSSSRSLRFCIIPGTKTPGCDTERPRSVPNSATAATVYQICAKSVPNEINPKACLPRRMKIGNRERQDRSKHRSKRPLIPYKIAGFPNCSGGSGCTVPQCSYRSPSLTRYVSTTSTSILPGSVFPYPCMTIISSSSMICLIST